MIVRQEKSGDIAAIRKINIAAFKTTREADIVDALRERASVLISLVAEQHEELLGHILFSPVRLAGRDNHLVLFGLGPLGVLPEWQKKGVGSALVSQGLKQCAQDGVDAVAVLGHPDFYPKFGFETSKIFNIQSEYNVPDNLFMVIELKKDILKNVHGTIKYHDAFNNL